MTESVRERILQHVQATLEAVTVEHGYQTTLQSVQRFQQDGQQLSVVPVAVLVEGGDDVELDGPMNGYDGLVSHALTLSVVLIHRQDTDVDSQPAAQAMNRLIADVQKAMQADPTRGGVAINTEEIGVGELDAEEGQPELVRTVGYRIRYRHRRTDPTIAG